MTKENRMLLSKDEMSYINAGMPPEAKYGEVFTEIAKAQDRKTAEQIYKEIGAYLEQILIDAGYHADAWGLAQRLKQGLPPEAGL